MTEQTDKTRAWYQAAVGTAIVAGMFSLVVATIMVRSHVRTESVRDSEILRVAKEELNRNPDNRALQEEIRDLDLVLRQKYAVRTTFNAHGGALLACGLVAFFLAAKAALTLRKPPPDPGAQGPGNEPRQFARWAVMASGGVVVVGAVLLALSAGSGLPEAAQEEEPAVAGKGKEPVGPVIDPGRAALDPAKQWPRFRGPGGNGVSPFANVPMKWDGKSGEGILWKTPLPLSAPNSPVRWGEQLFMSAAVVKGLTVRCELYGFDAVSGKLQWTHAIEWTAKNEDDLPEVMEATGFAAPTVATDGSRVYAFFATGQILACTLDGKEAWVHNFGKLDNSYGHGSSLAMDGKQLIVLLDQAMPEDKKSRLYAFDGATGKVVWETVREMPHTWATPIVIDAGKRREIIVPGDPWLISYDAKDGKEAWRAEVLGGEIAPSPVFAGGLVISANSGAYCAAIRPGGSGDVTKTHVPWKTDEGLPDISSPSATDELVFLLTSDGLVTCFDIKSGKLVWEHETDTMFSASPSLAAGKLFVTSEKGVTIIIEAGREYKELGRCELGEPARASFAFGDGRIYLRGKKHLYCIGQK